MLMRGNDYGKGCSSRARLHFFLGTNEPAWLPRTSIPLMLSRRRLQRRVQLPRARGKWFLDSGGFSELALYGRWTLTPREYVHLVRRYRDEIGGLELAAPQDWMCEPVMLQRTGLTLREHQSRTVRNFQKLQELDDSLPWIPVVQGWTVDDYLRCVDSYDRAGVRLSYVGVGSVCRRESTQEARAIFTALRSQGLDLHAFGVKTGGLSLYGGLLRSADSLSWSFGARKRNIRLPGCKHVKCGDCMRYAMKWRRDLLNGADKI